MPIDSGIYGAQLTAMSVIVVYHLFSIQTWVQAALTVEAEVEEARATHVKGDLEIEQAKGRIRVHMSRFPWMTVFILGIALAALGSLGMAAGLELKEVRWWFTCGPVVVLIAVFLVATLGAWFEGKRALDRAGKDL